MTLKITHKHGTSASTPPAASDIDVGEIAINSADADLFTKDTAGAVQVFKSKFTQSGTGAVPRTIASKLSDAVSVLDFGAVGDGVTDDTAAIQAGVDAIQADGGPYASSKLIFPPGSYLVTSSIVTAQDGLQLEGQGLVQILIGTNDTTFIKPSNDTRGGRISGFTCRPTSSSITGARFYWTEDPDAYTSNTVFSDLNLFRTLVCSLQGNFILSQFERVTSGFNGSDLPQGHVALRSGLDASAASNVNIVRDSFFVRGNSDTEAMINLNLGGVWTFEHCDFEDCKQVFNVTGVRNLEIRNCWFEGNTSDNLIRLDRNPTNTSYKVQNFKISSCFVNFLDYDVDTFISADSAADTRITIEETTFAQIPTGCILTNVTTPERIYVRNILRLSGESYENFVGDLANPIQRLNLAGASGTNPPQFYFQNTNPSPTDGNTFGQIIWQNEDGAAKAGIHGNYGINDTIGLRFFAGANDYTARMSATTFAPGSNNTVSLGTAAAKWSVVYSGTGSIDTSDATTKQDVSDLSDPEKAAAITIKGLLKRYKFNDAVAEKGDEARWHFGVMAQDIEAVFAANGLNAREYGLFCEDVINEETGETGLGVRYSELFAFILAAL